MYKKTTLLLYLLIMILSGVHAQKKGDVNGDDMVNIADVVTVTNQIFNGTDSKTAMDVIDIVNLIFSDTGLPARLVVWKKDGSTITYALSDEPITKFMNGQLVLTTKKTEVSFPLTSVLRYTFQNVTKNVDVQNARGHVHVRQKENCVILSNLRYGCVVELYSSSGQLLDSVTSQDDQPIIISVDSRPDGMYIVKTEGQTIKLLKK